MNRKKYQKESMDQMDHPKSQEFEDIWSFSWWWTIPTCRNPLAMPTFGRANYWDPRPSTPDLPRDFCLRISQEGCLKIAENLNNNQGIGEFSANLLATKKYFVRMIPTLKHYSDTVSDIPSGSMYCIFILAFYLTFFLAFILTFYLTFWHLFWSVFWHSLRRLGWGPAVPTDICNSQLRSGSARGEEGGRKEEGKEGRKEKATLIKSRDPHLAGGEQQTWALSALIMNRTSFQ